jgi:hypothetical protein
VFDDNVPAVDRIFPDFRNYPVPGGVDFGSFRGRQVHPFMEAHLAGNRILPYAEGAGQPENPQGETKARIKKKIPFRGAEIGAGVKEKFRFLPPLIDTQNHRFLLPGSPGGGSQPFQVRNRVPGDKNPRYGGKEDAPGVFQGHRMAEAVQGGHGGIGDIAPGRDGKDILAPAGNILVYGQGLGDTVRGFPGSFPVKKPPPACFHVL